MQASELKIGDTVALNSNGPNMTVSYISGEELNLVYWNAHIFKFEYINLVAACVFKPAKK